MISTLAIRRALTAVVLFVTFLVATTNASATHLRGGTLTWKITSTTSTSYTVQFTLVEAQRWSYPNTAGSCTGSGMAGSTMACAPVGTTVQLQLISAGTFNFGDGTAATSPSGTVTSVNQAEDVVYTAYTFSHTYAISGGTRTAYFYDSNRISTLKLGHDLPEYISTTVSDYSNGAPVSSTPAILAVPLQNTLTLNIASAVSDIDPNANLVFRLSTFAEMVGPPAVSGTLGITCPGGTYVPSGVPSANPPGFTISSAGVVTWSTTAIANAITTTGTNCSFGVPAAGDLWGAQVMVEAHDKTTNALITQVPIDFLMKFVTSVGALPTITLSPSGTQTVNIGTPVSFSATGNTTNNATLITLNATGVPAGATTTGLNATVAPPATSTFNWTPTAAQAGSYVVTYTVTDSNLQQAQASKTLVVAKLPTISCPTSANTLVGNTGVVTATLLDPNSENLNIVWKVDGTTVQTDNNFIAYPSAVTDSLNQGIGSAGVHTVTATATDPHGVAVSCSTSVMAYQPTSLLIVPQNVTIGTPVAINATLVTVPGGLPVAGQNVTFSFTGTGAPSPDTTTTDASGVASVPALFTAAGSLTATAKFINAAGFFTDSTGDIPPAESTGSATITVAQAATSLSSLNAPSSMLLGNTLTVSTTLTRTSAPAGTVAGVPVVFSFAAPGDVITTVTSTTDANGVATATTTPTANGEYIVSAQFAGTAGLQGSTSNNAGVGVYQRASLVVSPASGTAGSPITVNASLTAFPGGAPLAGQTVVFDFGSAAGQTSAVTSAGGVATVQVVFTAGGSFPVTATFSNAGFYTDPTGTLPGGRVTSTATVTVASASTSLSSLNAPQFAYVGNTLTVSTVLTQTTAPSGPVSGLPVVFSFTAPGGVVTMLTGTTDISGVASATITPTSRGVYSISAQFAGTAGLLASTSSSALITVYQRASLLMAPTFTTIVGHTLTVSASLITIPGSASVAGQTVTFNFGSAAGSPGTTTAVTSASGVATVQVVFTAGGTFPVTASFSNPAGFFVDSTGVVPPIPATAFGTVTVSQGTLTATGGSYSGTYDGNTHALSACVTSSNPDGLTCTNSPTGPVGPGVGAGVVTPVISGSTSNYTVTLNNGAYSITPASSAVTVNCPASMTYTGSALTPCTATVTGAGGLSQSLPVTYTANVNAGTATATASYAGDANHTSSTNSATFIITSIAQTIQLVTTARLFNQGSSGYQASITVTNTGAVTAQNVQLAGAALGSTAGTGTPIFIGNLPGGTSITVVVNFPASAGTPGTATVEMFTGTYAGGTFNGSLRVTLPN